MEQKLFSMLFLTLPPALGTLLRCDCVVGMLRLHLAKLIKRIPLRFTRENQISFPFSTVNCKIYGTFYGTKMVFHVFSNIAITPWNTIKV